MTDHARNGLRDLVAALAAVAGLVGSGAAGYVALKARAVAAEEVKPVADKVQAIDVRVSRGEVQQDETARRLARIEDKLDQLLER